VTQVGSGYPVYNTIFSDSFQRANENPLNPTNWTTLSGGFNDLQILNNECEPSGGSSAVGAAFCTASFPSDQWAEFKINHLTSSNNGAGLFVRTTPNFNSTYYLKVIGPTNGTASARIQLRVAVTLVLDLTNQIVNVGDIFRLAAQGNVITVFQNGVSIGSITDSSFSSGRAGVRLDQDLSGQNGVVNFNAGSVSNGFATCTLQVSEVAGYTGVPVTVNNI